MKTFHVVVMLVIWSCLHDSYLCFNLFLTEFLEAVSAVLYHENLMFCPLKCIKHRLTEYVAYGSVDR